MIPDKLLEAYYVFCIVFTTILFALMFGYFVAGFIQGVVKAVRRRRQARESRRYLNEVIGRIEKIEETDEGVMVTGVLNPESAWLLHTGNVNGFSIGMEIPNREPRSMPHFTLMPDGEIINNFPDGVPAVDNRRG